MIAVGSLSASNLFGPGVAGVFSALMAISIVSTVNAMVTIGPRVYYAMAKNHAFFPAAAKVHPRWHTPVIAILSQGLCAMVMTAHAFPAPGRLHRLQPDAVHRALGGVDLRIPPPRPGWQRLRALEFAWPLIPASYILVGTCMMVYGVIWQPRASLTALATVGVGALVYRYGVRAAKSEPRP